MKNSEEDCGDTATSNICLHTGFHFDCLPIVFPHFMPHDIPSSHTHLGFPRSANLEGELLFSGLYVVGRTTWALTCPGGYMVAWLPGI